MTGVRSVYPVIRLDNMKIKLILTLLTAFSVVQQVQSSITECLATNNISDPASQLHNSTCCQDTEWVVRDQEGQYKCEEDYCWGEGVLYLEDCHDVYEDGVCGEEALGERLYLGEDGLGYCDCDEGWVRYKERCYQEFTPAFCPGENEILKLNTKPKPRIIFGESGDILAAGLKHNFSCIANPCEPSNFPHT